MTTILRKILRFQDTAQRDGPLQHVARQTRNNVLIGFPFNIRTLCFAPVINICSTLSPNWGVGGGKCCCNMYVLLRAHAQIIGAHLANMCQNEVKSNLVYVFSFAGFQPLFCTFQWRPSSRVIVNALEWMDCATQLVMLD